MRKIVSFASTPNEAIKWSELGKYKRLSKEELYIYDFENIEEVHFIGSKKGENDYEIEETKWGIYINMEEAILLYICSWQTKEFQLLEKINKNIKCLDIRFTSINELDISEFDKINKLVLSNNRYLGLVNGIEKISGLRELYLNNSSIEKNPDLNNFPEIYVLNLSNTLISDLEGDEVRRNCKFLDLSNTKIKSCKTIQIFPNLRRLSLQETDIVSLKGIEQLKKLESLNCRDTRIETINEMSAITFTKEAFEDALQKQIIRNIKSMQIIDTMFSDSWIQLKKCLQEMQEFYIDNKRFMDICDICEVEADHTIRMQLLDWFSDLGISFCYSDSHQLANYMVLKI